MAAKENFLKSFLEIIYHAFVQDAVITGASPTNETMALKIFTMDDPRMHAPTPATQDLSSTFVTHTRSAAHASIRAPTAHGCLIGIFFLKIDYDKAGADLNKKQNRH